MVRERLVTREENEDHASIYKLQSDDEVSADEDEVDFTFYAYRWVVLLGYCLLSISIHSGYFIFTSVSHLTRQYYGISIIQVNTLDIVYELAVIPFVIPFSYLATSQGLRTILIITSGLNALGTVIRLQAQSRDGYNLLLAGSSVSASALAGILFLPPRIAGTWFGKKERGLATGIAVASDTAGMILGFLESTLAFNSGHHPNEVGVAFHTLLITQTIHACIVFLFVLLTTRSRPPTPPNEKQAKELNLPVRKRTSNSQSDVPLPEKANLKGDPALSKKPDFTKDNMLYLFNGRATDEFKLSFLKDIRKLLCNYQFLVIVQLNANVHCIEAMCTIFLNELMIRKFPHPSLPVSLMGVIVVLMGAVGNVVIGSIIRKTNNYIMLSIAVFGSSSLCVVSFALCYLYFTNYIALFISVCLVALTTMSYYTLAFEFASDETFPVPESTSAMLIILYSGMYTSLYAFGTSKVLLDFGPNGFFILTYCMYFSTLTVSLFLQIFLKQESKDEDQKTESKKTKPKPMDVQHDIIQSVYKSKLAVLKGQSIADTS